MLRSALTRIRPLRHWADPRIRVLVASVPRCGSTYLFRSIAKLPPGGRFPRDDGCTFTRNLSPLPEKPFLKTHGLAPPSLPDDVRAVFLFGDPICAVVSTRQNRFNAGHFRNCGYNGTVAPDIYERDDLGYERIFDSWTGSHEYPVLALRYETLNQHQGLLSRFLGRRVRLRPRRARGTSVPDELRSQLITVYGRFVEKVDRAPDATVLSRKSPKAVLPAPQIPASSDG